MTFAETFLITIVSIAVGGFIFGVVATALDALLPE